MKAFDAHMPSVPFVTTSRSCEASAEARHPTSCNHSDRNSHKEAKHALGLGKQAARDQNGIYHSHTALHSLMYMHTLATAQNIGNAMDMLCDLQCAKQSGDNLEASCKEQACVLVQTSTNCVQRESASHAFIKRCGVLSYPVAP